MKTIIFLSLLITSGFSFSQDSLFFENMPMKNGKIYYSEIITVDSTSKEELYKRAKSWPIAANEILYLLNSKSEYKDEGVWIGVGSFQETYRGIGYNYEVQIIQTFKISLKENRFKYEITDFQIKADKEGSGIFVPDVDESLEVWCWEYPYKSCVKFHYLLHVRMNYIIEKFKKHMQKPSTTEEEW